MPAKTKKQAKRYKTPELSFIPPAPLTAVQDAALTISTRNMPAKIIRHVKLSDLSGNASDLSGTGQRNANSVQQILLVLLAHSGHDFTAYRKSTITSRINRRLALYKHANYAEYASYLQQNPSETAALFSELLIGVTKFFRDTQAFNALKEKLTSLIKLKKNNEPVRIWVTSCSTGQEAYSIAMLATECMEKLKMKLKVQIFATDLNAGAIKHAREGIYYENAITGVSERRIKKFFIKQDDMYQVKKELRNMIVFTQHDLIKDAPFTRLDLLCCRNVMIYFTAELQKKIVPVLHYAINEGGLIFTGIAENISGLAEAFIPADEKWKIFIRRNKALTMDKKPGTGPAIKQQKTDSTKAPALLKYNHVKYLREKFTDTRQQLNMAVKQMGNLLTEIKSVNKAPSRLINAIPGQNAPYCPMPHELEQLNNNMKSLLDATTRDILLLTKQLEALRLEREEIFTTE